MTRTTFIVSRNDLDLVPGLVDGGRAENVEVVVDRHRTERRQRLEPIAFTDRRHSDRRTELNRRELALIGIAVVVNP